MPFNSFTEPDDTDAFAGFTSNYRLARKLDQYLPLSPREREILERALSARVQSLGLGIPLTVENDPPGDIHVILSGWACRKRRAANGRQQIVAFHLPGDVCDFGAFMTRSADSSIIALSPLRVASISRRALQMLTNANPRLIQAFWWESTAAASIQREWMVRVCQQSARERIAHLVCELAARLFAVGLADDTGFDLPITQSEIGGACGLTPEHTSRTLRELREGGLMTLDRGRLQLEDWDALVALAGFDGGYLGFRTLRRAEPDSLPTAYGMTPAISLVQLA